MNSCEIAVSNDVDDGVDAEAAAMAAMGLPVGFNTSKRQRRPQKHDSVRGDDDSDVFSPVTEENMTECIVSTPGNGLRSDVVARLLL